MERSKYILIVFLIVMAFKTPFAENRKDVYTAYVSNNMELWKTTINMMEKSASNDTDHLKELINFQYGYIAWCIGNDRNKEAQKYLDLAEINLNKLNETGTSPSLVEAYKAAFIGYKIGLMKIKAPFLGPESVKAADNALALDPQNWFAHVQYANIQFYMPSVFGGSKTEAINYYLKALSLLESDKNAISENWNYLNLLVVIGEAFEKMDQFKKAKYYYEKTLRVAPEFTWVKNELYPNIIKKLETNRYE